MGGRFLVTFSFLMAVNAAFGADKVADKIGDIFEDVMRRQTPRDESVMKRPVFGKDHGCVKAKFIINPKLDPEFKVGAFKGKDYPAWIRFANDGSHRSPDRTPAARGMSIKLVGVPEKKILEGEEDAVTQDFVMQNHPVFFTDTADIFYEFVASGQSRDEARIKKYEAAHPETKKILDEMDKNVLADPLDGQYWTPTPYQFGKRVMKYMVKPCHPAPDPSTKPMKSDNYLRENLVEHLRLPTEDAVKNKDICLNFWVQFQTDPTTTDKATAKWSEEGEGRFRHFATIKVPRGQNVDDPDRKRICENLSFTGWHATAELRPLGSVNEARKIVYQRMAKERRKYNAKFSKKVSVDEPTELKLED